MSNVKQDFILPIVVLTVICIVVSAALAVTESATTPIIEEQARIAAEAARKELLPEADSFEQLETADMPEGVLEAYAATNGAGYVVTTAGQGYGGTIKVMTGFDQDGKITNVKMLEHTETAGLGSKAAEEPFTSQFRGEDSSLAGVEVIGGATITSRAFMNCVQTAFKAVAAAGGGEAPEDPIGLTEAKMQRFYPDVAEFTELTGGVKGYQCGDKGYIIFAAGDGYSGKDSITVAVLFDENDTILAAIVDSINDTPGIGTRVAEEPFTSQFAGKKGAESIEKVAGASGSSEGFIQAVGRAVESLSAVKGA